jgi:predicted nucleotide-binding protein (sugar kinase/HSP70/actin superfamily)
MNNYEKNVFINCPFDKNYKPLLHSIIFTIIYLGLKPRITLERTDSLEKRIDKICEFIKGSKYGIHDLSRMKSSKKGEFFRLNMAFELGLDYGSRVFSQDINSSKKGLILAEQPYHFQAAISDISNLDIKYHKGDIYKAINAVRNWFAENGIKHPPSPTKIWNKYMDFMFDFDEKRRIEGFTKKEIYEMPIKEMIDYMEEWRNIIKK